MKKSIKQLKIRLEDIAISYNIRAAENGEATKTVIFLHGFPFNKDMWHAQLEALPADYTGIALDIRGHGKSTKGHGFFSIDVFAHDLHQFITHLKLKNVVLCGLSMGGYIAFRAHQLFPNDMQALVLSATHAQADGNIGKQKRFDAIAAVLTSGRRPFAIGFVKNVFSKNTLAEKPELVEFIRNTIRKTNVGSICATQLALASRLDSSPHLQDITIPTLYIMGAEDQLVSEAQKKELIAGIKGIQYAEFEDAAHLPNLEDPVRFNSLLHNFLASF